MTKRAWSVELESNAWQDDTFDGTVNGCITYCFNIVNSLDELDYPR